MVIGDWGDVGLLVLGYGGEERGELLDAFEVGFGKPLLSSRELGGRGGGRGSLDGLRVVFDGSDDGGVFVALGGSRRRFGIEGL